MKSNDSYKLMNLCVKLLPLLLIIDTVVSFIFLDINISEYLNARDVNINTFFTIGFFIFSIICSLLFVISLIFNKFERFKFIIGIISTCCYFLILFVLCLVFFGDNANNEYSQTYWSILVLMNVITIMVSSVLSVKKYSN